MVDSRLAQLDTEASELRSILKTERGLAQFAGRCMAHLCAPFRRERCHGFDRLPPPLSASQTILPG